MKMACCVLASGVLLSLLVPIGPDGTAAGPGAPSQAASASPVRSDGWHQATSAPRPWEQRSAVPESMLQGSQRLKIDADYGKMPVHFIPNQGQMDRQVAYYVQGKDKSLYFTPAGVTIALTGAAKSTNQATSMESGPAGPRAPAGERWAVKLDFVGATEGVMPVGEDETGAVVSYFKGQQKDWRAGLPTYSRIVYRDLWPGIDLVYHGTANRLKYEFVVHPGADPSRIRLAYRGTDSLSVDDAGRLNVMTPQGGFQDDVPVAYQEKDGGKVEIELAYEVETAASGDAATNARPSSWEYGFKVGDYDSHLPLVLDPAVIVYCGFIGGSARDQASAIAVDALGNAYVTGSTLSTETTFPASTGPDLTYSGGTDAFIAKVNPAGSALIYCGYIGGDYIESSSYSGADQGYGIAVDGAGCAYVIGFTNSSEVTFPVIVGPDLTYNGVRSYPDKTHVPYYDEDAFVAKINAAGTALVYCGYIGGAEYERGLGIAVDAGGNALVSGYTWSTEATFPVTVGPDVTYNGAKDAFVAKVNAAGTALSYCGYVGGSGSDSASGIALDSAGNSYLVGSTESSQATFPVLAGPGLAYRGNSDAFVAKIDAAGASLSYCGYIGGYPEDHGAAIAVDGAANAYVVGTAASHEDTFPASVGPDITHNGHDDAFIAKVAASGAALVYCGFIGGSYNDYGNGVAVDGLGNAYVAGKTFSAETSFPVREGPDPGFNNPFNPASPVSDGFVARVNPGGTGLVYCGYIGGSENDACNGIAVDGQGNAYVTGATRSSEATFPVAAGPDLGFNGTGLADDAFVAKISYREAEKHAVGDVDGDGKDEVAVDFGPAGIWLYDQGGWSQLAPENPESLLADRVDPSYQGDILADLGSLGLWIWHAGDWSQMSPAEAEGLAVGLVPMGEGDVGKRNLIVDFGGLGLWLWPGYVGTWYTLGGTNADQIVTAELGPYATDWIIGDFGSLGLWAWDNSTWSQRWIQLSGLNPDYLLKCRLSRRERLVADFGPLGLWSYIYSAAEGWARLTDADADSVIAADTDGDGIGEIVGDFGPLGLWLWDGQWTELSGADCESTMAADVTGDGSDEVVMDFGSDGLWVWNNGPWSRLTTLNPEYLLSADTNGDGAKEILGDFGARGFWMWNGAWTVLSEDNPD